MKYGGYVIREHEVHRHLVVKEEIHALVKDFAIRNDLTITEATYKLVTTGLLQLSGLEVSERGSNGV